MPSIKLLLVLIGFVTEIACLPYQNDDGGYRFSYETSKETGSHSREEEKTPDGLVVGKYSYVDPTGDLRVVNYQAGDFGYVAKGAVGVAGAPESQFPAESTDGTKEYTDYDDPGTQGNQGDEGDEKTATTEKPDENNEDGERSVKVESPVFGVYPDGFPIGFFDQGIQGWRRLPQPEEKDKDKLSGEIGERSTDDNAKADSTDATTSTEGSDKESKNKQKFAFLPHGYVPPVSPYFGFHPHVYAVPLHHEESAKHPVYVYAFNGPENHGYYYHY